MFALDGRRLRFVQRILSRLRALITFDPKGPLPSSLIALRGFVAGSSPFLSDSGSEWAAGPRSKVGAFPYDSFSDARVACSRTAGLEFFSQVDPACHPVAPQLRVLFKSPDFRARAGQK